MNKQTRDIMFSSEDMNAVTPQDFFDQINIEFQFTLDAAASIENTKCKSFFNKEQNALIRSWHGRVWINPPYGRTIGQWVDKAIIETSGPSPECCVAMLLPARTDTKWFHDIAETADEIRFIKGRLRFEGNNTSAPFPSMLAIWYGNFNILMRTPPAHPYEYNLIWRR